LSTTLLSFQLARAIGAARRLDGDRRDAVGAVLRRGRGGRGRGLLHRVHRLHHQEHGKSHDEEGEDGVDEDADVDRRHARLLRGLQRGEGARLERNEPVGKIDAARQQRDDGHHNIFDERGHDGPKRSADDYGDGQINHIPARNEILEFFQHVQPPGQDGAILTQVTAIQQATGVNRVCGKPTAGTASSRSSAPYAPHASRVMRV